MTYVLSASRTHFFSERYLAFLALALAGYALFGKGFAYLGVPPLFIGEIALSVGIVILLRSGCLLASLATMPSFLLACTMAWVLLRTLPFIGVYGFDALRDSVVILYGGFAFIVIGALLEDPQRINLALSYYGSFLKFYIPAIPFILAVNKYLVEYIPTLPWYNVPLIEIKTGEAAVHLSGAVVFVLAGFGRLTLSSVAFMVAALAMVSTGRGAFLAFAVPVFFAVIVLGKMRAFATIMAVVIPFFCAAYLIEMSSGEYREPISSDKRPISTRQIVDNLASIVGHSGAQTEGTKEWRLQWWNIIIANTVLGPNFWTGRGFGLNLADADGFRDGDHPDAPALRSPHNVHMTVLARAGVPGAVLWGLLLASWTVMLTGATLSARHQGQKEWAGLFLFIACYVIAMIVNASFDVALEGPMLGIWFWCLIGFGIGSVMIFRCQAMPAHRRSAT
ncbi:MAG: O-antigen ligase family protein [Acidobacteriaceae bacterium]|nr:O-antigen ligase family protein [Acidobacteriaceae bacterium]MBV9753376.1 O-antigen ligase family protein [Hyphomicrobiales bacterium]